MSLKSFLDVCHNNRTGGEFPFRHCAGVPRAKEPLAEWKTRLRSELAHQKRAEQERAEQERTEQRRAEEHTRLERQRVEELERQEMVRKAGDIGRWLHQDLGFDGNTSATFGVSLRACDVDNPKSIFAMDKQTLEGVLGKVEMPELLTSLVMEAWRRKRKVCSAHCGLPDFCIKLCTFRIVSSRDVKRCVLCCAAGGIAVIPYTVLLIHKFTEVVQNAESCICRTCFAFNVHGS